MQRDALEHSAMRSKSHSHSCLAGVNSFPLARLGLHRAQTFGPFADAGSAPSASVVEVIACFIDVRGFTNYVRSCGEKKSAITHFIRDYFAIFPTAVLRALWALEEDDSTTPSSSSHAVLRERAVPAAFKPMGDGMMLVWELTGDHNLNRQVAFVVVEIMQYVRAEFLAMVNRDTALSKYGAGANDLKLGCGIAQGDAVRLDFGQRRPLDYAGHTMNLASRLQDQARKEGIVAEETGVLGATLSLRAGRGEGRRVLIPRDRIKGTLGPVPTWQFRTDRDRGKQSGTQPTEQPRIAEKADREWFDYLLKARLRLGVADASDQAMTAGLMTVRMRLESMLAAELARRVQENVRGSGTISQRLKDLKVAEERLLKKHTPTGRVKELGLVGRRIHTTIALGVLPSAIPIIEGLWRATVDRVRKPRTNAKIHDEHSRIIAAIAQGQPEQAAALMRTHLKLATGRSVTDHE